MTYKSVDVSVEGVRLHDYGSYLIINYLMYLELDSYFKVEVLQMIDEITKICRYTPAIGLNSVYKTRIKEEYAIVIDIYADKIAMSYRKKQVDRESDCTLALCTWLRSFIISIMATKPDHVSLMQIKFWARRTSLLTRSLYLTDYSLKLKGWYIPSPKYGSISSKCISTSVMLVDDIIGEFQYYKSQIKLCTGTAVWWEEKVWVFKRCIPVTWMALWTGSMSIGYVSLSKNEHAGYSRQRVSE